MKRKTIRVDPLSSYLERRGAPVTPVVQAGDLVYGSGIPPFDPACGFTSQGDTPRNSANSNIS